MNAARRKNIKRIMSLIEQMDALKEQIAEELEAAIKTYLPPRIAEQLDKITDDFIGGKAK